MDSSHYHKILVQAGAGAVGFYLFNNMFNGGANNVILFGREVSTLIAGAGMGAASAVASEAIHKLVLPHIPVSDKLKNSSSAVVNPASSAATWYLTAKLGNNELAQTEYMQLLGMGAVVEIAGNYAQKVFLSEDADALKF
jgi:hypothetical protein